MKNVDALKSKTNLMILGQLTKLMENVVETLTRVGTQDGNPTSFYLTGVHDTIRIMGGLVITAYHAAHDKGGFDRANLSSDEVQLLDACDASAEVLTQVLSLTENPTVPMGTPTEQAPPEDDDEFDVIELVDGEEQVKGLSLWKEENNVE